MSSVPVVRIQTFQLPGGEARITTSPEANVIKLFSPELTYGPNEEKYLTLACVFSLV
jgi:hypothetical protein